MKNRHLFKVGILAASLLCSSVLYTGCGGDDDNATPSGQNPSGGTTVDPGKTDKPSDIVLVSELKCTVAEFAEKYETLKKGEKVSVTLTDVSDANIAKVSETLRKMSASTLSKAGESQYLVALILQSIDNALKTIPADAFKGVEVLREVVIPACVEAIKSDAFAECVNLAVVKILGEDTKVDEKAFENANSEIKIEQAEKEDVVTPSEKLLSPADIVDYVNASEEDTVTLNMPLESYDHIDVMLAISKIEGDKKVKLVIPEGVKELSIDLDKLPTDEDGRTLYPEPNALVGVDIPNGTMIGYFAFNGCKSIASIEIPEGATEIGDFAFQGCSGLVKAVIPGSVEKIGTQSFASCNSLNDIVLSEGLKEIGFNAFHYCTGLTRITIPESVTVIRSGAFNVCENLISINIPKGVSTIDTCVFGNCYSLAELIIPEGVTVIDKYSLSDCISLTNVSIPKSVSVIGGGAFWGCYNLTSLTIPEGVEVISYNAFAFSGITDLKIPKSVKNWGEYTMEEGYLITITIPDGVTELEEYAFYGCDYLETIYCSQALYDKYHDLYPQMVVKGSVSGTVSVDDLENGKDIK